MFDYTKDYIILLKRDFKRIDIAFAVINVIFTMVYPIFAIFMELGNFYINISVLALALIHGIVSLIVGEKVRFKVNRAYTWLRIILSTVSLGINVYSIYLSATNVNGVAIVLSTVMMVIWVLKVLLNICYDLVVPRLETLSLCVKEDSKPIVDKIDSISKFTNKKPIFGFGKEPTPLEVLEVAEKSKKVGNSFKEKDIIKEINQDFAKVIDQFSFNDPKENNIDQLIDKCLKIDTVVVDKYRFVHQTFSKILDVKGLKKFMTYGPKYAGIKKEQLSQFCDELCLSNFDDAKNVKKYHDDMVNNLVNDKDKKKIIISFSKLLISMQEIVYLYGLKEIDTKKKIGKKQLKALKIALKILLDEDNKEQNKLLLIKAVK